MRKVMLFCLLLTAASGPCLTHAADPPPPRPENVSSFEARTPEEERNAFHLPEGFDIELVAAEPDIHKPLNIAFDDWGRLWVTDTLEYPFPAAEGATPRDGVKVLENFQPNGRAATIRTFADGLNIPIGLLPLPSGNAALVHSIPDVFRLIDTDADGRADRREVLYGTYGFKDTHGMTNAFTTGFDGWIYACHGFSNSSTVEGSDHAAITMKSGNVYRMRPEGTHLEYFTHGQVNPFGLAFDPLGNLYSSDCHSRPIYQLLRGAWYPSFGAPHDGLGFGPDMMKHDHGSTGIAGVVSYAANQFPEPYRGTMFIGNVVTNRINHDRLEWHGSSPKAIQQPDFLWSDDNWFRPVDLELGPDGALYVADFYNRIIGHYEVPLTHPGRDRERGRIWRIVYRGTQGKGEAKTVARRGGRPEATRDDLIADLGHANLSVRQSAANQLAEQPRYSDADSALKTVALRDEDPWRRVHALWVLHRRGLLDDPLLKAAAGAPEPALRVHAQRLLGEQPSLSGLERDLVLNGLGDSDPLVQRCAAEALGRHPDPAFIGPLLQLRQTSSADDTHLVHVVRMALRDQFGWAGLEAKPRSDRDLRDVADVATGVPSAAAARFLLTRLRGDDKLRRQPPEPYVHHVARYGAKGTEAELTEFIGGLQSAGLPLQAALLKAAQQGIEERGAKPAGATRKLAQGVATALLDSPNGTEVLAGIQLATNFRLHELDARLTALARDKQADESSRTTALSALSTVAPVPTIPLLGQILSDPSETFPLREKVVTTLGTLARPASDAALLAVLPTAPGRLQTAIASSLVARLDGARALLDAVAAGKASARVLQEPRVARLLALPKLSDLKERLDGLLKGLPPADNRINELLTERRQRFDSAPRDPEHGAKVFEKTCMACHQVRGQGARVGPQLDGIGSRGVDRLLEDILDPSRNVDQAFRTTQLALTDGRVVTGLLLREEGEVLVLADSQGKEVRISRNQVEDRSLVQLSPMPANFVDQVAEADLHDLLAYLLATAPR
jgi:putative heme-binding domain-containing protein